MLKNRDISNNNSVLNARGKRALADVISNCKCRQSWLSSVVALDGVTSFLRLKEVTNAFKRMQHSQTIGGILQCNGGKLEESEYLKWIFVIYYVLESK